MIGVIKADEAKRIVAGVIDFAIGGLIFIVLALLIGGFIACLGAATFLLLRDNLAVDVLDGMSPGKKLMALKAVQAKEEPCDHVASIKRNLTIASFYLTSAGLVIVFALVPFVESGLGYILGALIGLLGIGIELYEVMTDPRGLRLGDLMAGTHVIETAFEGVDPTQWLTPDEPSVQELKSPVPPPSVSPELPPKDLERTGGRHLEREEVV